MRSPIHLEPASFKKDIKPDDPPQDVDIPEPLPILPAIHLNHKTPQVLKML